MLISALTRFYTSLGAFAASALVSLVGAVIVPIRFEALQIAVTGLALLAGVIGVGGLVFGCILLIRETRLTVQALREEASMSLLKSRPLKGGKDAEDAGAILADDDNDDPNREREADAFQ